MAVAFRAFWSEARKFSVEYLFSFHGAPDKFLDLVQNVNRRNKGYLEGFIGEGGQVFFLVGPEREGAAMECGWLTEEEGLMMKDIVIGELPPLKLEFL